MTSSHAQTLLEGGNDWAYDDSGGRAGGRTLLFIRVACIASNLG